jgi:hypothetical protein
MQYNIMNCSKVFLIIMFIAALLLLLFYPTSGNGYEPMAPLNTGTYPNNYPKGRCIKPSFEREPCMVGNCPLGTSVDQKTYCKIQCSQESDIKRRDECEKRCAEMIDDGLLRSCPGNMIF